MYVVRKTVFHIEVGGVWVDDVGTTHVIIRRINGPIVGVGSLGVEGIDRRE